MILILTTEAGDFSHLKIIDWLEYYNADYFILTGESIFEGRNKIILKEGEIYVNNINITRNVNVVYNRRWFTFDKAPLLTNDKILNKGLISNLSNEIYEFRTFLNFNLKDALWVPKFSRTIVNKLSVLETAKKIGINVPDYIVTNSKKELEVFFNKKEKIITKAIGNFAISKTEKGKMVNPIYTKVITKKILNKLPETFFLSIVQEYIAKDKEYRILFFNDKIYTVEILTQEYENTIIDSRNIDQNSESIRIIKSFLPQDIEKKIIKLMKKIDLNIGSIDMIERDGLFFFLEVNPVGQMSGYSIRGNLDFEKEIVEFMINYDKERNRL